MINWLMSSHFFPIPEARHFLPRANLSYIKSRKNCFQKHSFSVKDKFPAPEPTTVTKQYARDKDLIDKTES